VRKLGKLSVLSVTDYTPLYFQIEIKLKNSSLHKKIEQATKKSSFKLDQTPKQPLTHKRAASQAGIFYEQYTII
jgi:hypothetical protein